MKGILKKTVKIKSLTRPIILELVCNPDDVKLFQESINAYTNAINKTSRMMLKYIIKYPKLISRFGIRDILQYKKTNGFTIPDAEKEKIFKNFNNICDKYNLSKKRRFREDIATIVGKGFRSRKKRFPKKPIAVAPIIKSNKAIRTNSTLYKVKDNIFSLEIIEGKPISVFYIVRSKNRVGLINKYYNEKLDLVQDRYLYGGIIEFKNGKFIAKIVAKFKWVESYKPSTVLGIDINKRGEAYLAFSDGVLQKRPDSLTALLDKCTVANENVEKAKNASERSFRRKQLANIQRAITNEALKLVPDIIQKVKDNNALLCIDGAKPGANLGEYGQIITTVLKQQCELKGIPHIWVDEYHTSTTCVKCGYRDKKNRPTDEKFLCLKCGHPADADVHAAQYTAKVGKEVYGV